LCGIVGLISRRPAGFNFSDMEMYENMLLIDSLRGKDSTGAFTRFRNGDVRVIKHGSHPFNLFRTNEWKDFKNQVIQRGKFVIGHNRAATRGVVNTDNAHPFVEDNIILVHNGTLREQKNLTEEKTDVDSHAIAHALSKGSYAEVLPQINGAFALVWYDTETDRLYAARNDERPLNLLISNDIYFLSSEAWIAGIPAGRNNIKVTENIILEPGEVFVFTPDGKYTVEKVDLNAKKSEMDDEMHKQWNEHVRRILMGEDEDGDSGAPFEGGKETPDTKALRTALAEKAKQAGLIQQVVTKTFPKTTSMGPSASCALTLAGDTTQTPSKSNDEEQAEARSTTIHANNASFPRDLLVLVKVMTTSRMVNNRFQFSGIIYSPELERVDVKGFLPHEVLPSELGSWLDTLVVARVQYNTHSIGGWTVHVRDTKKATYTSVHEKEVPIMLWDFARNHCQCSTCNRQVEAWEKCFTGVKLGGEVTKKEKPINTVIVTCPDCIIKKIEKEDFRAGFEAKYRRAKDAILAARAASANRVAALQNGKSVGEEFIAGNGTIVVLPGSTTLQ
jgi:hypothetical protein